MLDFAKFCPVLPKYSCSSSGNPKICQLFRDFSAPTFSSAFSPGRPRAPGLGWADFLPFPSCSSPSTASWGVSNLPRNIPAVANPFYSQGFIPACRMESRDRCRAEALGFGFILWQGFTTLGFGVDLGVFLSGKGFFFYGPRGLEGSTWWCGRWKKTVARGANAFCSPQFLL